MSIPGALATRPRWTPTRVGHAVSSTSGSRGPWTWPWSRSRLAANSTEGRPRPVPASGGRGAAVAGAGRRPATPSRGCGRSRCRQRSWRRPGPDAGGPGGQTGHLDVQESARALASILDRALAPAPAAAPVGGGPLAPGAHRHGNRQRSGWPRRVRAPARRRARARSRSSAGYGRIRCCGPVGGRMGGALPLLGRSRAGGRVPLRGLEGSADAVVDDLVVAVAVQDLGDCVAQLLHDLVGDVGAADDLRADGAEFRVFVVGDVQKLTSKYRTSVISTSSPPARVPPSLKYTSWSPSATISRSAWPPSPCCWASKSRSA